jgi:ATP-binding protein involved in chromosome partitioning
MSNDQTSDVGRPTAEAPKGERGRALPVMDTRPTPKPVPAQQPVHFPELGQVIAISSGKGGVGKSTVATNLALALATLQGNVGLMDADVYGPSVPLMLGIDEKAKPDEQKRLVPIERHGIKVMSMGFFVANETPIIWRGPMLTKLITEFLRNCDWGQLDTLVMDLPPGTGDVQLTLTQQVAISGGIVVTTPQEVALADVRRGIQMFRQVNAPVLGVIENMSFHVCSGCGARAEPFGHGGGAAMARELGVPFLGELPLVRAVREAGDRGVPIVAADPSHPVSRAYREIAERVLVRVDEAARREAAPPSPPGLTVLR